MAVFRYNGNNCVLLFLCLHHSSTVHFIVGTKHPGQKPRQTYCQHSGQQPRQKTGPKTINNAHRRNAINVHKTQTAQQEQSHIRLQAQKHNGHRKGWFELAGLFAISGYPGKFQGGFLEVFTLFFG